MLEGLGLNKQALARLRDSGMPYLRINRNSRAYIDVDVIGWLKEHNQRGGQNLKIGAGDSEDGLSNS